MLALKQVQQHARREGGGVSILPSGEVRYIEPRQQITSPSLGRVSTQVKKVEEKVE